MAELIDLHDLAALLGMPLRKMTYFLYVLPEGRRYREFDIQKRTGGKRRISAPILPIKQMQRAVADWLIERFQARQHVHSYIKAGDRSIRSNADRHLRQRWVLRVDLEDFFPSIHFGRVRGVLMARPFSLPRDVAQMMAHLCCHHGALPQGAPSSPVLSNLVCRRMDRQLAHLAKKHRCSYTRYSDDMTFSTRRREMPGALVEVDSDSGVALAGPELRQVIEDNDFRVNDSKTTLRPENRRQMVTGLIVNEVRNVPREYVRRLRDQLYAWRMHGDDVAERMVLATDAKNRPPEKPPDFRLVLRGRVQHVGSVRGWTSFTYLRLAHTLSVVDKDFRPPPEPMPQGDTTTTVHVFAEGKTDHDHLQAAVRHFNAQGKCRGIQFQFRRDAGIQGDDPLYKMCNQTAKTSHDCPHVFVFDNDNPARVRQVTEPDGSPKRWGNGVFSLVITKPAHRSTDDRICIEMLYTDNDLSRTDPDGRRLFLRKEFNRHSGKHYKNPPLFNREPPKSDKLVVEEVYDESSGNYIGLSKAAFASAVLNAGDGFVGVSFAGFEGTLDQIEQVVDNWKRDQR